MVDVKIQPTQGQRMRDRAARLHKLHHRPGLRVEPKNDALRAVLQHPLTGMKFRPEGSVEWPDNSFTRRRIRDGDVKIVEEKTEEKKATPPKPQPRDAA